MMVKAAKVQSGDRVRRFTGEVIKVLCSNPETQSAQSGSTTAWHIEGYAEGRPTCRIICDPNLLLEVVERP
jgi:hypothetical protein